MNDSRWETSGAWKEPRRWIIAGWILLGESSNFTFRSFRQINLFSQIPLLYDVVSAEYLLCVLSVLGGASTRHRDVCMLFGQSHWYTNLASLFSLSSSLRLLPLSHGLFLPRPQNLRVQRSSSSRSQNNAKVSLAGCWPLNIQCPTTRRSQLDPSYDNTQSYLKTSHKSLFDWPVSLPSAHMDPPNRTQPSFNRDIHLVFWSGLWHRDLSMVKEVSTLFSLINDISSSRHCCIAG